MTAAPATTAVPASTADAGSPAPEQRRRRRPGRLSLAGAVLGLTFGAMSITPSLVPRAWYLQALVTGLCIATGYGLGAFAGWAYRALGLPNLSTAARRLAWKVLAVLAVLVVPPRPRAGSGAASSPDQRELLGMDTSVPLLWLAGPLLGLLVAALLLGIGASGEVAWVAPCSVRSAGCCRRASPGSSPSSRPACSPGGPSRACSYGGAITVADAIFAGNNDDDKPGVVNPAARHPLRWADLERHLGEHRARGPRLSPGADGRETISAVVGDDRRRRAGARLRRPRGRAHPG